jgi:hypothetical protein
MPTLADIYSAINTAKRKGSDFVQNPVTSLQQMLGNANDRARVYNEDSRIAGGAITARAKGQQPTPEQLAAEQRTMDAFANAYNPVGMTVFHGSPHLFERFSMGKIGTGEGNQAYGRGLYMAQAPEVAKEYKQTLAGNKIIYADDAAKENANKSMPFGFEDPIGVLKHTLGLNNDTAQAIKTLKNNYKNDPDLNAHANYLANMLESGAIRSEPAGYFYKVDLPDTHIRRMLDFDSPLKNQPKPIRNLAKSLGMDLNDLGGDLLARVGKGDAGKQILQDAGIPGVKYLDQTSRDAKTGTRNFVVFDDKHLKILERNDQPIK